MDQTAFESWLSGIGRLTDPQRRLAWRSLALSEAGETHKIETIPALDQSPVPFSRPPDASAAKAPPVQARSVVRPGKPNVMALGQHRVDSFGCPHCNNLDVVRWGHASDLPC